MEECQTIVTNMVKEATGVEMAATPADLASACIPISGSDEQILMNILNAWQLSKLCRYDTLDQYYFKISDSLIVNTCIVSGSDSTASCAKSAGRVCAGISRGRSVVGTIAQ